MIDDPSDFSSDLFNLVLINPRRRVTFLFQYLRAARATRS